MKKEVEVAILDLRICNEGMSCGEYSLLMIAGPIQKRMDQHASSCSYHRSKTFHQSALDFPVTDKLERAAKNIIKKYNK